jgi:DNA-binding response OmpR family regulator
MTPKPPRRRPKGRVLVADDDALVRRFLDRALTHEGYAVHVVDRGQAVLDRSDLRSFQLLLLDEQMGPPTGFEVLGKLRKGGLRIPVILMSSQSSDHLLNSWGTIPRTTFLFKPFLLEDLRRLVSQMAFA